jgi:ABC-type branched-subunit amino acid transport system substrate-binding protein
VRLPGRQASRRWIPLRGRVLVVALVVVGLTASCSVHSTAGAGGLKAPKDVVSPTADTDRGLSATTITLGAVVYRQDTFAQFGLSSLGGKPVEELFKPLVDDLNAHGGIAGRHVVLAVSRFSPLVPAEAQTACVEQADDKKVFLTVGEISLTDDAQERCLAAHQTPVITSNSSSLADLQSDRGWVHQTSMAKDRLFKNWVDWLVSSGTATPTSKIGLLHADTAEDNALTDQVFLPYLGQRGLKVVAQAAFSGTSVDSATADAQNAALKFKASGVDLVLPDLDFLRSFVFLGAASVNGLTARYSVSDLGQLSLDVATSFYPASFDGTTGITAYSDGLSGRAATAPSPALQDCLNVVQAGGQQLSSGATDRLADILQVAQFCEDLQLVARVASFAGPHLNRASFVAAFDQVTNFADRVTMTGPLSYGPSKFDGPDSYAVIRWQAKCASGGSCYVPVEPFAKGRW